LSSNAPSLGLEPRTL